MQVINKVNNASTKSNGGDVCNALEQPAMDMVQNSNFFFLQLNAAVLDNKTGNLQRLMGFGNPVIFGVLKGKRVNIYIDGTFRIAPHPLYQCLIVMAYDKHEEVYVIIMYTYNPNDRKKTGALLACYDLGHCCF